MNDLDETRKKIDAIDAEMAELFEKRMKAVADIAEYKREHGLPVFDGEREKAVVKNNSEKITDDVIREYYVEFLEAETAISRKYQARLSENGIIVGKGILNSFAERFSVCGKTLIVTDDGVSEKYAAAVASGIKSAYKFVIPHGEGSKNIKNFSDIIAFMLENGFTRTDNVVAVGGGVVGDLAGFVAASYMRGVNFYNVPTTFLAQADASVGGKTAIDFNGVKNCVGAFYAPKGVLIDTDTLETLDRRQLSAGIAEAIKTSSVFDEELFSLIENTENFGADAEEIIKRSLKIKKRVVGKDYKESGLRRSLNFGHTVGHAIESVCFPRLLHGECVALGTLVFCSEKVRERLIKIYEKYSLPVSAAFSADDLLPYLEKDKKASGNEITAVYCGEIGSFEFIKLSPSEVIGKVKEIFGK